MKIPKTALFLVVLIPTFAFSQATFLLKALTDVQVESFNIETNLFQNKTIAASFDYTPIEDANLTKVSGLGEILLNDSVNIAFDGVAEFSTSLTNVNLIGFHVLTGQASVNTPLANVQLTANTENAFAPVNLVTGAIGEPSASIPTVGFIAGVVADDDNDGQESSEVPADEAPSDGDDGDGPPPAQQTFQPTLPSVTPDLTPGSPGTTLDVPAPPVTGTPGTTGI